MKKYIMGFKDDVSGEFNFFGIFNNIELGKRDFHSACQQSNVPAADLSLYVLSEFDTASGSVITTDDSLGNFPEYIMRGVKEE